MKVNDPGMPLYSDAGIDGEIRIFLDAYDFVDTNEFGGLPNFVKCQHPEELIDEYFEYDI